jgi:hypothetical protein
LGPTPSSEDRSDLFLDMATPVDTFINVHAFLWT